MKKGSPRPKGKTARPRSGIPQPQPVSTSISEGKTMRAIVTEALANAHFRLEIPDPEHPENPPQLMIGYLAGKMRLHRIRVIVGDSVEILMDSYGGKPRIVRRL